jgi:hypothetical protein
MSVKSLITLGPGGSVEAIRKSRWKCYKTFFVIRQLQFDRLECL